MNVCRVCHKTFSNKSNCKRHEQEVHTYVFVDNPVEPSAKKIRMSATNSNRLDDVNDFDVGAGGREDQPPHVEPQFDT